MRHSCGAILYAYDQNGDLGIILGMERTYWLPFKGGCETGETFEETAIREVYEETCKLVKLNKIVLGHKFTTKHKHYHIGLCEVPYNIIKTFHKCRNAETETSYREKQSIKFFLLSELRGNNEIHKISHARINYFWRQLIMLASDRQVVEKLQNCEVKKKKTPFSSFRRRPSMLLRQQHQSTSWNANRQCEMQRTWRRVPVT